LRRGWAIRNKSSKLRTAGLTQRWGLT
jgi:hypothetical protein